MNQTTQTDKDSFGDRLVRHWVTLSSFSPLFFLVAILGIHVEITIFSSIYNVFGSLFDAEKLDLSFNSQWPVRIGCIILITLPYWQLKVLFLSRIVPCNRSTRLLSVCEFSAILSGQYKKPN